MKKPISRTNGVAGFIFLAVVAAAGYGYCGEKGDAADADRMVVALKGNRGVHEVVGRRPAVNEIIDAERFLKTFDDRGAGMAAWTGAGITARDCKIVPKNTLAERFLATLEDRRRCR